MLLHISWHWWKTLCPETCEMFRLDSLTLSSPKHEHFFSFLVFYYFLFLSFFPFFCFVFFSFVFFFLFLFNWKEKLSFRAWRGSEIHLSNSRCSTISPLDEHALNRPFHVFVFLFLFFLSFSTFDINELEKIRQLRCKESF